VVQNPGWISVNMSANAYQGICVGEPVILDATFKETINPNTNYGRVQWFYSLNGGTWVPVGYGSPVTFSPVQEGTYTFMATYVASNELSGCHVDPFEIPETLEVTQPVQLEAHFAFELMEDLPLNTCASNPFSDPIVLVIEFNEQLTPPFNFTVKESNGTIRNLTSHTHIYELPVTPRVTTIYTIESMEDHSKCNTGSFVKSEITVYVTDVEIFTTDVEACDGYAELEMKLHSFVSDIATIEFVDLGISWTKQIVQQGNKWILTIDMPNAAEPGIYNVIVTIDKCEFPITIVNNYSDTGENSLVLTRWEGLGEVLVVNNNPATNGGYTFTSYQWYKNGEMIPGATQQYYQDPNGVNGWYSVRLTGTKVVNGVAIPVEFRTCEKAFNPTTSMKIYPVPAHINETVFLELDLTPAEMKDATLDIYDAKGALVKQMQIVGSRTRIEGMRTSGMYTGKITTGTNEIKAIKFVIVQ